MTLSFADRIAAFQERDADKRPWARPVATRLAGVRP
jgi:hypothetical protein